MLKNLIKKTAAVIFLIVIWQLAAYLVSNALLLPSPIVVAGRLFELCLTAHFWQSVGFSLARIALGIIIAVALGVSFGFASAASPVFDALVKPMLSVVKATPVASFIMLALLWIDRSLLPAFIAVLIVLPVVVTNVASGIKSTDKKLVQVATVYRFSLSKKLRYLYLPSVYPYFLSACRASLGLAWKAGIAAEVLAVPALSIGKMIYESKLYLETVDLFAWTAAVVILSVVMDVAFEKLMRILSKERRVRADADN